MSFAQINSHANLGYSMAHGEEEQGAMGRGQFKTCCERPLLNASYLSNPLADLLIALNSH